MHFCFSVGLAVLSIVLGTTIYTSVEAVSLDRFVGVKRPPIDIEERLKTAQDCGKLKVYNGSDIAAGTLHNTTVNVTCHDGFRSYYASATCLNGIFTPSSVVCLDYAPSADAVTYQGQWFKVFENPSWRWDQAADVCAQNGGILATVLSPDLMSKIRHIIPNSADGAQTLFGLKQKSGQAASDVGWQWIDSGNGDTIDIDKNITSQPIWRPEWLDDYFGPDSESYGTIVNQFTAYGVNDGPISWPHYDYVLCQIAYPYYQFKPVEIGSRMIFPLESTLVDVDLNDCAASCLDGNFCRAFSYSTTLRQCHQHSVSPRDPEARFDRDSGYIVYA